MRYLSIDIETTGLDPSTAQVIQLAMVVESTETVRPVSQLPYFDMGLVAQGYSGDSYAMGLNERLLEVLRRCSGIHESRLYRGRAFGVARDFNVWTKAVGFVNDHFGSTKVFVAGKNAAGFDLRFIRAAKPELADRFHHRVIDVGSVALGAGHPWTTGVPSMSDLLPAGTEVTHDALEDALDNIRVLRGLTNDYRFKQ